MSKVYKIILSIFVVVSTILVLPVVARDAGEKRGALDRTGWTGLYTDKNGKGAHSQNHASDGDVSYMLDNNDNTLLHCNYSGDVKSTLPAYIFIDLNGTKEFSSFSWLNRASGAVKHYEFYVAKTSSAVIPSAPEENYEVNLNDWELVSKSTATKFLKSDAKTIVDLDKKVKSDKVLIKVLATHDSGDNGSNVTWVTCKDFKLFYEFQTEENNKAKTLDRTNWSVMSYNDSNQEYYELGHPEEGNPQYLIDGNTGTWWHTTYEHKVSPDTGTNTPVPYYVVVDLSKDDAKAVDFKSFSWTNRGFQSENIGANGVVTKYKFYITNDDSVVKPFTFNEGTKTLNEGWTDITTSIIGCEEDSEHGVIGRMGYGTTSPSDLYTTYANLNETKSACKVMIEILETKNSTKKNHGSGVEFYMYKETSASKLDLTSSENLIGCSAGIKVNGDGAHDDASVLTDQKTDTKYVSVDAADSTDKNNPGTPVYFQIDMKRIYNIDKIVVDVFDGRTYNNVVVVVSDTEEGFEKAYERAVLFNTDAENKTGLGSDRPIDPAQSNVITAYANYTTTGRYVRVYTNGSTENQGNHVYEVEVYGSSVDHNSIAANNENTLVEGYYTDDTFTEKAVNPGVTRYVHNSVLDVKKQVKLSADGSYSIRFVSSVASLNAKKVGFKLQKNSGTPKEYTNGDVYTILNQTVNTVEQKLYARDVFDNQVSNYFSTFKLNGIPANATGTLYVTPFWELDNGDKFYGATVEYDIATVIAEFNAN